MSAFEAKRISDTIDQALKVEKAARDAARRKQRKILVLGQSESGKSTLIKQFRLLHSVETFAAERQSWKSIPTSSIVYLNIIRSMWKVLEIVSSRFDLAKPIDGDSHNLARLRLRLMPLRSVELSIVKSLSSPKGGTRARSNGCSDEKGPPGTEMEKEYYDVVVHPDSIWQRLRQRCAHTTAPTVEREEAVVNTDDPARTLEACAADMKQLWSCSVVRQCLKQTGLFIEEISGFFLNDIERIASPGYVPTDDDILRSRIKTIGPTETILPCLELGLEWKIYDVGGARRQRAKWAPFFDDMDSIAVMVPVSAFDQVLAEDPSVNRLQDSFDMWRDLCKTTILRHIPVLLLLNKIDLLEKKLHAGIKISEYLISYGDRPNELKNVLQYLNAHFIELRERSGTPDLAPCYIHRTSLVNRATTQIIVTHVRDKIAMEHGGLKDII